MAVNIVQIGTASVSDILSAMEDIGFTVDTSTGVARWGYDTNAKLYFKVETSSSNTLIRLYNSSNSALFESVTLTTAQQHKMAYERIGNSIIFGFHMGAYSGNQLMFAVVEPKETGESWLYCVPYRSANTGTNGVIDGATEVKNVYGTVQLYNGNANGIQIAKYYDGSKFVTNLFMTSACASIPGFVYTSTTTSVNNYVDASIGDDSFLIVNFIYNNQIATKLAFKRPASN
jgi:hypothetical protein